MLPAKENITIPAGEIFWLPDGALRPYSLGHTESFSWNPTVEVEDVFVPTSGVRTRIGELEKEVMVSVSLVLKEMRPDVMAMAMAGSLGSYTQTDKTAETLTIEGGKKGELVDFGALDVTVSSAMLDNGVDDPFAVEAGAGYTLYSAAGKVVLRADGDFEFTYSAPAITSGRSAINIFNKTGLEGVFTVIGKNTQGKRYMLRNFRASLRPDAEIPLLSDGSSIVNVELSGSGVYNEALPLTPWGELIELA